ncbi:hypothetical protein [Demequina gelatinilytica]|uniref:hypothetical protein n=1 Tax=Demequina gelatinilytica TaxID=1638980 RepID=UPI000B2F32ED|nr:hypothetical protein [Demequina gelatinilytica]
MGIKLVKHCYEHWGSLPAIPFRLLVGMAATAFDDAQGGKPAAMYFAGLDETMRLAGTKRRAALGALAILREHGAIELVANGRPGRNATFRLHCEPPSASETGAPSCTCFGETGAPSCTNGCTVTTPKGAPSCTCFGETGAPSCTNGCTVTTPKGAPSCTPRNNEDLNEEGKPAMPSSAQEELGGLRDDDHASRVERPYPRQCLRHQGHLNKGDDFEPCLGCRDADAVETARIQAESDATAAVKAERRRRLEACGDCDDDGWLNTARPARRCTHPRVPAAVA